MQQTSRCVGEQPGCNTPPTEQQPDSLHDHRRWSIPCDRGSRGIPHSALRTGPGKQLSCGLDGRALTG